MKPTKDYFAEQGLPEAVESPCSLSKSLAGQKAIVTGVRITRTWRRPARPTRHPQPARGLGLAVRSRVRGRERIGPRMGRLGAARLLLDGGDRLVAPFGDIGQQADPGQEGDVQIGSDERVPSLQRGPDDDVSQVNGRQ
jgi:hypothetical protein